MLTSLVLLFSLLSGTYCMDGCAEMGTSEYECFFCELAVTEVVQNPGAFKDLEALLDKICGYLPVGDQPTCIKAVGSLDKVWQYIHEAITFEQIFTPFTLCTMVDICTVNCCVTPHLPEQVHLSYIGDPHTSMGITWVTQQQDDSIVQYSNTPNSFSESANGTARTYTSGGWNGWVHFVQIFNLKPGVKYYYRVGNGNPSYWSSVFSFTTEPTTMPPQRTLRIVNIGDMGANLTYSGSNIKRLKELVSSSQIDWVLHNGDISYADGYQGQWDIFFREVENIAANVPYMVTVGNHEIGIIGALNLSMGYIHRFQLPGDHSISTDVQNLYYSFDYGNVHFVALDTESVYDIASFTPEQASWLAKDLASVDRKKTPWVIVYGHRPLYCSNNFVDCEENPKLLVEAGKLFNKYKVDLVLSAHRHNYERFWPTMADGTPVKTYTNPGAPMYILNGAGGNREGPDPFGLKNAPNSVVRISQWGYGIITVYNDTTLQYTFHDSDTNAVADDVFLVVNH